MKHWHDPYIDADVIEPTGLNENSDSEPEDNPILRDAIQAAGEVGTRPSSKKSLSYCREGMFNAWQQVVFAPTEEEFITAWKDLNIAFGKHQSHIIAYISREYMPWKYQWAKCFIDRYRNYGQRVNSPTETAHKDIKSYLESGGGTLLQLHHAIIEMLIRKTRDYKNNTAIARQRQRGEVIGNGMRWLGNTPLKVAPVAIEIVIAKSRHVIRALLAERRIREARERHMPHPVEEDAKLLPPCDRNCTTWNQYTLPCSHTIYKRLHNGEAMTKELFGARWWLKKPLNIQQQIMQIQDPDIVTRLRGRPKRPQNQQVDVPPELQVIPLNAQETPTPMPSQQSQGQGGGRGRGISRQLGRSSQASTTRLTASIRRERSQFEVDELASTAEASSVKRPRGNAVARAQGSQRGGRGRGRGRGRCRGSTVASTPPETIGTQVSSSSSSALSHIG
ncbi:hypothetical protein S7711_09665, partial [Stachybotrys chartarum IBT 7711]